MMPAAIEAVLIFLNYQKAVTSTLGLPIYGEANDDQSGVAVSLSENGRRVAIAAHLNDGGGLIQAMFGSTNSLMAHGNSKALTLMDPLNKVLEITRTSRSAYRAMAPI